MILSMPKNCEPSFLIAVFLALVVISSPAMAGPPFITDDPEPVDYEHGEINFFSQATTTRSGTSGIMPGVDANYGLLPDWQIHMTAQLAYNETDGGRHDLFGEHHSNMPFGVGDTELGVKYRFLHEDEDGWLPQIAIYPLVELPTGNAKKNLGAGNTQEFIPLWAEKNFGPWQTYGGGGYWNNPGTGNKNYWFYGWVLQRKITDDLTLGGEVFHQTANKIGGLDTTGFNVGGSYDFTDDYHLLFSAGQGLQNSSSTNQLSYYLALQWTF